MVSASSSLSSSGTELSSSEPREVPALPAVPALEVVRVVCHDIDSCCWEGSAPVGGDVFSQTTPAVMQRSQGI